MATSEVREWIHVTENERAIFDLLLRAVSNFNPKTELRVAGGWVRDKLLGKESNDIDIAINNMSGKDFLLMLNSYLYSQGEEQVQGQVIRSKTGQHLETVKMLMYNHSIDLVQLRSEIYNKISRVPVIVVPATPEQDSYRRDLTINSLFYNIHTRLVEDHTGRGIDDLKSGKIATPLPAQVTFLEDPLRVLRAIRFGARFGFTLDEELKNAASSEEVRIALAQMISKERIGNEIDLIISGNRPVSAVTYLSDLKLFGLVFALPSSSKPAPSDNCDSLCRAYMEAMWNLIQTPGLGIFSGEQRKYALYAALLLPFRNMVYKDHKGKLVPVVNYILKVSMKRKASDAETVVNIHLATEKFLSLILPLQGKNDVQMDKLGTFRLWESISPGHLEVPAKSKLRVLTGLLIRDIKDLWRIALLTSLLLGLCIDDAKGGNLDFQLDKNREIYLTIRDNIHELGLDNIWAVKPLVDGNDIVKALQLNSSGPVIREWQRKLLAWQLAYPKGMQVRQNQAKRAMVK